MPQPLGEVRLARRLTLCARSRAFPEITASDNRIQ